MGFVILSGMESLPATNETPYHIAIVGGGINGVAIARDAALRGLNVYLCERGDLAGATSSASSKIAHGGLRYLETREFAMVRKSLREREVLLNIAPHLVTPMGFILPHASHLRPRWLIRLGLFIYDHLYRSRRIPRARGITFAGSTAGQPLKNTYKKGFVYGDGWMDDARLVTLTALDAAEHGATIAPHTTCTEAVHDGKAWKITTESKAPDGTVSQQVVRAKTLVNAAGPWAERFLKTTHLEAHSKPLTLVKGSHIVVPRLFDHHNAYTLQTEDERVVFAFPYEKQFTLIGTTDTPHEGNPADARPDEEEIEYLCDTANRYFSQQITPEDVVWAYSGVRPLIGSSDNSSQSESGQSNISQSKPSQSKASKASRDYSLHLSKTLPLLNIWGGKLTAHRQLAEDAVNKLASALGSLPTCTTATTPLPGGDIAAEDLPALVRRLQGQHPRLNAGTADRLVRAYGTRAPDIFAGPDGPGQHFGGGLYQAEVDYLIRHEWARSVADILWRRSKLGLHLSLADQTALKDYVQGELEAENRA